MMQFKKATKRQAKARIAIDGPSGSGKTYSALIAAQVLARGGQVAVVDTERGSASLYADLFEFDVLELDRFDPRVYVEAIQAAEEAGYAVIVLDSLSHAWEGEGGALDLVDDASKRSKSGNSFTAWKDVTPLHRRLVDAMLQSKAHVIATMRTKMEYVQEKDERTGKTVIRKVGMAPIQRQGIEYEFTIVGDMDIEHNLIISKSRCAEMADAVVSKPDAKFWKRFADWLNSGEEPEETASPDPADKSAPNARSEPNGRPWDVATLRDALHRKANHYTGASEKWLAPPPSGLQGRVTGTLNNLLGDDNRRHTFLKLIWDSDSMKTLNHAQVKAMADWLEADEQMAQGEANLAVNAVATEGHVGELFDETNEEAAA